MLTSHAEGIQCAAVFFTFWRPAAKTIKYSSYVFCMVLLLLDIPHCMTVPFLHAHMPLPGVYTGRPALSLCAT